MYKPQGNFEAVRYGELYGNNPDATKREMRQNGRQFRRYLRSDVADRDRAMFEDMERSRAAGDIAMRSNMGATALAAGFDRSIPIDTEGAMSRMQAGEEASAARSAELAAQDLNNRIAGAARFNDAFRMARQAGLKTFKWKGGVYGTELAQPGKTSPKPTVTVNSDPASAFKPGSSDNKSLSPEALSRLKAKEEQTKWIADRKAQKAATLAQNNEYFLTSPHFRDHRAWAKDDVLIMENGKAKSYPMRVSTYDNASYALDPSTGLMRKLYENSAETPATGNLYFGSPTSRWADGSDWVAVNSLAPSNFSEWDAWYRKSHPLPVGGASIGGRDEDAAEWSRKYNEDKKAAGYKQGGRFNRVNYFQQGGAVQQDAMAQVQALVQAAAQGDEQATQQITQIMEAAKAGDQQAMQIAQMIQQVVQQMQGQATSAKWGAKVNYIKSLKYAKGGKTCPTCEK